MIVTVTGTLLEKYSKNVVNFNGVKEDRFYLRLYQKGNRMLVDINAKFDTYNKLEIGKEVTLKDITLNCYKDVIYAREWISNSSNRIIDTN